jgi:myosin heavy subunit
MEISMTTNPQPNPQPQQPAGNQVSTFGQQLDSQLNVFRARNQELKDREEKIEKDEKEKAELEQVLASLLSQKDTEIAQQSKQLEDDRARHHQQYRIVQHEPAPAPAPAPSTQSTDGAPDPADAADTKLRAKFTKLQNELDADNANGEDRKAVTILALAGFKVNDLNKVYKQLGVAPGTRLSHEVLQGAVDRYVNPSAPAADNSNTKGNSPSRVGGLKSWLDTHLNS